MESIDANETCLTDAEYLRLLDAVRTDRGGQASRSAIGRAGFATAGLVFRALVDLTLATSSFSMDDPHDGIELMVNGEGMIGACWHNRLPAMILTYRSLFGRGIPSVRAVAMISESKDGELVARLFRELGGSCVRGSTSRNASEALRNTVHELKRGGSTFVTPDGPRGPKHELQVGVLMAARLSGKPIVPISGSFGRAVIFQRSWDQFVMPLPFGRITVHMGEPLFIPRRAGEAELAELQTELQRRMMELTTRAEAVPCRYYRVGEPRERKLLLT